MKILAVSVCLGLMGGIGFMVQAEDTTDNPLGGVLENACRDGNLNRVKVLLDQGAPIDAQVGNYRFTPLMAAVDHKGVDVLKYLLGKGAQVDLADSQGSTPLLHACNVNDVASVKVLLNAGANPNLGSKWNRFPLMYATENGNDEEVKALLANHADVNANCDQGPAIWWAISGDKLSTAKILLDAGANLNLPPLGNETTSYTSLEYAATRGNVSMVNLLLARGNDINNASSDSSTILMVAAGSNKISLIEALLKEGAQIELKDNEGKTALIRASIRESNDAAHILIEHGADINATDVHGETALTYAGDSGDVDLVDLLRDKGAKRTDIHVIAKKNPEPALSAAHAWALAVAVIYSQRGRLNPKILGGDPGDPSKEKTMLKRDWNIHDKNKAFCMN